MIKTNRKHFLPAIILAVVYVAVSLFSAFMTKLSSTTYIYYDANGVPIYQDIQKAVAVLTMLQGVILSVIVIIFSLKADENSKKGITKILVFLLVLQVIFDFIYAYVSHGFYFSIETVLPNLIPHLIFAIPLLVSSVKCNKPFSVIIILFYCARWIYALASRIILYSEIYLETYAMLDLVSSFFTGVICDMMFLYLWYVIIGKKYFVKKANVAVPSTQKQITLTEDDLESLKAKYDSGLITADEYNNKKAEIMSRL